MATNKGAMYERSFDKSFSFELNAEIKSMRKLRAFGH